MDQEETREREVVLPLAHRQWQIGLNINREAQVTVEEEKGPLSWLSSNSGQY